MFVGGNFTLIQRIVFSKSLLGYSLCGRREVLDYFLDNFFRGQKCVYLYLNSINESSQTTVITNKLHIFLPFQNISL